MLLPFIYPIKLETTHFRRDFYQHVHVLRAFFCFHNFYFLPLEWHPRDLYHFKPLFLVKDFSSVFQRKCDTVLNHTGLYEYRHGKMLMRLRFTFESLNTLNSPGEYMRYYRQLRGLTTRQLAEKLNIVPTTVLAYEQGRFPIPYEISIAATEILHISEELLFDDFCIFISAPYTEILHTVRKRYGLNQVDFAESAGISPSLYAKWESGSRRPSRKMYQQLKAIYPEI